MSGATFSTEALMALAMNKSTTPVIRLLMFACERADRTGLAVFDAGELRDLLYGDDGVRNVKHDLGFIVGVGLALPDSTAEEIRLNVEMVQPEGWAQVGARYGSLTLTRRIEGDRWLAACDCGSLPRTYRVRWLEVGITTRCADVRHRQSTA